MNEAHITVVGWLAADPYYRMTEQGTPFLSLRVGCTPRRFDRSAGQWQDLDSMFLTVNCWRGLAENVNASEMRRGDPVLVTGRLRLREYTKDGVLRFSAEIEASTLGHDLSRGSAQFRRVQRAGAMTDEDRLEAREANDRWALGGPIDAAGDSAAFADGAAASVGPDAGADAGAGAGAEGRADEAFTAYGSARTADLEPVPS